MAKKTQGVFVPFKRAEQEKAICFAVAVSGNNCDHERSLNELCELAESCNAIVVGKMLQRRSRFDAATYLGKGKLQELKGMAEQLEANLLICDDELSAAQLRNIEDYCRIKVVDRSLLILDIFARRAKTAEGKLQVELAQQAYLLPRLQSQVGFHSRTGGGIGTRGPGETIMDRDRRHIRNRITALRKQLKQMEKRRNLAHAKRQGDNSVLTIAVVGYTNAGKSTLVNKLCKSDLLTEDKVFATLDPTTRRYYVPELKEQVLMTDTVGFVRKLPHHLVEAFKSTLEEAAHADLILHVVDAADPYAVDGIIVCEDLLRELSALNIPRICVLNKIDKVESIDPELYLRFKEHRDNEVLEISAISGQGLAQLHQKIVTELIKLGANEITGS